MVGGTINKTGSFTFKVTKTGADTVLAQIIRMVEQAQGAKLPIQALVDKVTAWFVPAVIAVAALTFVLWFWFGLALVELCVDPDGRRADHRLPLRHGACHANLDHGRHRTRRRNGRSLPQRRRLAVSSKCQRNRLRQDRDDYQRTPRTDGFSPRRALTGMKCSPLSLLWSSRSEHPIAMAITAAAKQAGAGEKLAAWVDPEPNLQTLREAPAWRTFLSKLVRLRSRAGISEPAGAIAARAENFAARPGLGAEAVVEGHHVAVGADRFMRALEVDVVDFAKAAARFGEAAKSPLYAAIDGELAGLLAIADPIAPTARRAVAALREQGLDVIMVTGDNRRTAEAIAREAGIGVVIAEVLPEGKIEALRELRARHQTIAFVGDGINDAPALAEADVGLAIGGGTDVAIEAADVVLMSGDLRVTAAAVALSRATMRNIKQNLLWAFAYNIL